MKWWSAPAGELLIGKFPTDQAAQELFSVLAFGVRGSKARQVLSPGHANTERRNIDRHHFVFQLWQGQSVSARAHANIEHPAAGCAKSAAIQFFGPSWDERKFTRNRVAESITPKGFDDLSDTRFVIILKRTARRKMVLNTSQRSASQPGPT